MFRHGFRLPFKILGIPIYLDITFLIVLPLFVWTIGNGLSHDQNLIGQRMHGLRSWSGLVPYGLGLIITLGLFLSVLIHELGHAMTARAYGVRTHRITLWLLGGVAQLDDMPHQRGGEAVVAIVGPIVSFAIAGALYLVHSMTAPQMDHVRVVLAQLFTINLGLATFNLLPALPLDGGRVLRSLLAMRLSHLRATRISAAVSKGLAISMGLFGFAFGTYWFILLAFFVYMAANSETQQSLVGEMLDGMRVRELMTKQVISVDPMLTVNELSEKMIATHHVGFPVIDARGQLLGMVGVHNLQNTTPETQVGAIMAPKPETVGENESAIDAFDQMSKDGFGRLIVTDAAGSIVGIVTKTDLMRAIQVRSALSGMGSARADIPTGVLQTG